jgi:hypothetical protein
MVPRLLPACQSSAIRQARLADLLRVLGPDLAAKADFER